MFTPFRIDVFKPTDMVSRTSARYRAKQINTSVRTNTASTILLMLKLKKFSFFVFGKGGEGVGCTSFEIKYQYFNSSDL